MDSKQPWWQQAFGADYADRYRHRSDAAAAREIKHVLTGFASLGRPLPRRWCDACCGGGRHLMALHAAGIDAWGFDWSAPLLAQARKRPGLASRVVRGDVRLPPLAQASHQCISLFFTAFGYFDDAENGAVLQQLLQRLTPDGLLMLDVPVTPRVLTNLQPHSEKTLPDGSQLLEQRRIHFGRVEKTSTLRSVDGTFQRSHESLALYDEAGMHALVADAGGRVHAHWHGYHPDADPDAEDARWLWWIARR